MTRRWATRALALAAAVSLTAPAAAGAQGGLSITPARIEKTVKRGSLIGPVLVRNDTGRNLDVTATALIGDQQLDGLPVWRADPAEIRRARRLLGRVSPGRFQLAPGRTREVRMRIVAGEPVRGRGSYGVILFSATERDAGDEGAVVATRLRLTTALVLSYGGPGQPSGPVEELRAEQGPKRTLRFEARVNNSGNLHGTPRLRLRIRDARGRTVARLTMPSGTILPFAKREFSATLTKRLRKGSYTARVHSVLGRRRSSKTIRFRLVGTNRLPTADLKIDRLPVPRAEPGEPFTVQLQLRNEGTAAAQVAGFARVGPAGSQATTATKAFEADPIPPGGRASVPLTFTVEEGSHRLDVSLAEGNSLQSRTVVFATGGELGAWDRFRDWVTDNLDLVLGIAVGLVVLAFATAAGWVRRTLRRARETAPADRG